jgi:hypothetical protein
LETNGRAPNDGSVAGLIASQPSALRFIGRKERKYLLERHHIRARLFNPGGSVLLTASALVDADRTEMYSGQVGSDAHMDLLECEDNIQNLLDSGLISNQDLIDILNSFDSLSASKYLDHNSIDTRQRTGKRTVLGQPDRQDDYSYESPQEIAWQDELSAMTADYVEPPKRKRRKKRAE